MGLCCWGASRRRGSSNPRGTAGGASGAGGGEAGVSIVLTEMYDDDLRGLMGLRCGWIPRAVGADQCLRRGGDIKAGRGGKQQSGQYRIY